MFKRYSRAGIRQVALLLFLILAVSISALSTSRSVRADDTIVVNTSSDTMPPCTTSISLRCALAMANLNTTSPTTIVFNFSGSIPVGTPLQIMNTSQPITIDAAGHNIDIDGGGETQIFNIASGTQVSLNNLSITGAYFSNSGVGYGGSVLNNGTLSIKRQHPLCKLGR